MSLRVRFEDEADHELRAAAAWYEKRRVGLGGDFLGAVESACGQVVRYPEAGSPVPRVLDHLRVRRAPVRRFSYQLVYFEVRGMIRVLAVAHDRRRPRYWMRRVREGS